MIDIEGGAVLALWNGAEASRRHEYNVWHTREHVPERISVPGMTGARRYVRSSGPLPEYLTLYMMDDTGVLRSEPYRKLLDNPTEWSRSMRPSFRGFLRLCSLRLMSLGGGLGGCLAAIIVDDAFDLHAPAVRAELDTLLQTDAIVAAHVLERDRDVPDVPFQIGGERPDFPNAGAILLEGYDLADLTASLPCISASLARLGLATDKTLTLYTLAYALDRASLDRIVTRSMPKSR